MAAVDPKNPSTATTPRFIFRPGSQPRTALHHFLNDRVRLYVGDLTEHAVAARRVVYTIGAVYGQRGGAEAPLVADCYCNAIELAVSLELKTVAFPAISTGFYVL